MFEEEGLSFQSGLKTRSRIFRSSLAGWQSAVHMLYTQTKERVRDTRVFPGLILPSP